MRLANLTLFNKGGFILQAEATSTIRTAGGLFVFQSSVFRINEKLHNVKQGLALTNIGSESADCSACSLPIFIQ